ncbi:hypothetical protein ABU614_00735 [Lysobacter firmicutimachus]|uniref:Restriction endonuclease n=1 Tax=Lysobacter firmicutimachus TaxID=1792846 RepID=A0AAU8MTM5_9GAMM
MTMDLVAYLKELRDNNIDLSAEIYAYHCKVDVARVDSLKKRIIEVRKIDAKTHKLKRRKAFKGKQARHLGLLLERLMRLFVDGCNCISVGSNVRSTSAEIDFLLQFKPEATTFPMFRDAGTHGIGEVKCVNGALKTEWIHELAGLLPSHGASLAIIFTAAPSKPVSSFNRSAIATHAAGGKKIVPFGMAQVERVLGGENFLAVLADQYVQATAHTTKLVI